MITSRIMQYLTAPLRRLFVTTWPSAVVALAAWISIVVCIDPAGSYPSMPEGPGLTVDEVFNVEQGVLLVEQARSLGWLNLIPGTSLEAFKPENGYLPDHPPLGRYWLGVHHHLTWWLAPPFDPDGPFVTACARTGSATAFALTVWMIGAFAGFLSGGRIFLGSVDGPVVTEPPGDSCPPLGKVVIREFVSGGKHVGFFASLALVLMPRLYGHAHLAALESITNLTCTAAVLAVAAWWNGTAPPSRRVALFTGIVLGLALLTKIQAVLIPMPVALWALWRWRANAIVPLLIWGTTAFVVFFASWPYLWLDPVGHLLEYLGRTTNRATIHCYYFGVRYADKDVPWHYPFVMFAVTVPVALHVLGVLGLWRGKESGVRGQKSEREEWDADRSRDWLLLGCTVFPLIVFALPGVAVYDGERLFLTSYPLWALFVGRGLAQTLRQEIYNCGVRIARFEMGAWIARFGIGVLIVLQFCSNLQIHPCYLSYYNLAVCGLPGADYLGLELNYWGDAVTRELLQRAKLLEGRITEIEVRPSLHQFQSGDLLRQSPILRSMHVVNVGDESRKLVIAFHRRADLRFGTDFVPERRGKSADGKMKRQFVLLAGFDLQR
jgi:hypothetical protein